MDWKRPTFRQCKAFIFKTFCCRLSTGLNKICNWDCSRSLGAVRTNGKEKQKAFLKILRAYSKLQILSTMYNQIIGQLVLSRFKTTMAICMVASAFMLVKLFSVKDPVITGLSGGCLVLMVSNFSMIAKFCSLVHHDSGELHSYLLWHKIPGQEVSKEVNSFRRIGVRIGSFFLVKRQTPLTMLAMISNSAMSMLISVNFSLNWIAHLSS